MEPGTAAAATVLAKLVETVCALKPTNSQSQLDAMRAALLAQVGDARQAVLDLQEAVANERAKRAELEAENGRLRQFDVYRERYEMRSLGDNALVYAPKESSDSGEPPHYVCVACLDRGDRSILQFAASHGFQRTLKCSVCGACVTYRNK